MVGRSRWIGRIAAVLAFAVVVGPLPDVGGVATAGATPSTRAARDLPPVASPSPAAPARDVPSGNFDFPPRLDPSHNAQVKPIQAGDAAPTGAPGAVLRSRSSTSSTYDNPDGTHTAVIAAS